MSSILLTNPFAAPPLVVHAPDATAATVVAPVSAHASANESDGATSFGGSGAGPGTQADAVALIKVHEKGKWARSAEAEHGSVIGAQTYSEETTVTLGPKLPEVEMPDPLPTSPFLKRAD